MATQSAEAALEHLREGRFAALIGWFEAEDLECKRVPYRLDQDDQKFELAKDVASIANAGGGVLLIGVATCKSASHSDDEIEQITPFPKAMFDADRYRQTIGARTWPSLDDIQIETFAVADDDARMLAAVRVPPVAPENGPVLVTRTLNQSGRCVEVLFGLFERKRSHIAHLDARYLQQLIRDGRRFDALLHEELISVRAEIAEIRGSAVRVPAIDPEAIERRVGEAATAVQLVDVARFILIGVPTQPVDLRGLVESRQSRLSQLIDHPPELRDAGFDVSAGGDSTLVGGQCRRAEWQGNRLLEAYRDGMALFLSLSCPGSSEDSDVSVDASGMG